MTQSSPLVANVDANGDLTGLTVNSTSTSVTVSTADSNRGQVLGGSIVQSTTTVDAATGQIQTHDGPVKQLTPLQALEAVGSDKVEQLQATVQHTFLQNVGNHKVGVAGGLGVAAVGVGCALTACPVWLVPAAGVAGFVALVWDVGTHP